MLQAFLLTSREKGSKSTSTQTSSNASSILLHLSRLNYVNELRLEKTTKGKPTISEKGSVKGMCRCSKQYQWHRNIIYYLQRGPTNQKSINVRLSRQFLAVSTVNRSWNRKADHFNVKWTMVEEICCAHKRYRHVSCYNITVE